MKRPAKGSGSGGGGRGSASAPGLKALQRDLRSWGRAASQVSIPSAGAARLVAAAAAARAPRRTGRLAGSITARPTQDGAVVESSASYAVPVHELHPFAAEAARATEPLWLQLYVADLDRATARYSGKTY